MNEIVYLAGFFDGEGYVGVQRRPPRARQVSWQHRLDIEVTNTDPAPLLLAHQLWGGSMSTRRMAQPHHQQTYRWSLSGPGAAGALRQMLPYLIVKRREARIGLRFQRECCKAPVRHSSGFGFVPTQPGMLARRDGYTRLLRQLKQRGKAQFLRAEH